ncbi:MAG: 4'-phosphopantetheinyl transferase superfamily protein [Methylococcaceae bacterium]
MLLNVAKCSALSPLQLGVIDVWSADLRQLVVDHADCYALLDASERETVAHLKFQSLRDRYVTTHGILRSLLGSYVQMAPASLVIHRTLHGKPFLVDYPTLSFNMSHSSTKLLIAVTEAVSLGVDVEDIKLRTHTAGLVARCFAPEEQTYWHALSDAEKMRGFFSFWTRKEAFVKAEGQGISLGLERCVIDPIDPTRFLRIPIACDSANAWRIMDVEVGVESCAAVVAKLGTFKVNTFLISDYLKRLC